MLRREILGGAAYRTRFGTLGEVLRTGASYSGNERNRFFRNRHGVGFDDLSGISGLADPADGRRFAIWDFDRDGWTDFATVNANSPLLRLYHNTLGRIQPETRVRNYLAIRLVGGNTNPVASTQYSARDAYGAVIRIQCDGLQVMRELQCGQGFGAQNSSTLLIGLGEGLIAEEIVVNWPSNKKTVLTNVATRQLLTIYENPAAAASPNGVVFEPYERAATPRSGTAKRGSVVLPIANATEAKLVLYTTLTASCKDCSRHAHRLARLRSDFSTNELDMIGIASDVTDKDAKLIEYASDGRPLYDPQRVLSQHDRQIIELIVNQQLGEPVGPASLVTDRSGQLLLVTEGIPSLSDLRRLMPADDLSLTP